MFELAQKINLYEITGPDLTQYHNMANTTFATIDITFWLLTILIGIIAALVIHRNIKQTTHSIVYYIATSIISGLLILFTYKSITSYNSLYTELNAYLINDNQITPDTVEQIQQDILLPIISHVKILGRVTLIACSISLIKSTTMWLLLKKGHIHNIAPSVIALNATEALVIVALIVTDTLNPIFNELPSICCIPILIPIIGLYTILKQKTDTSTPLMNSIAYNAFAGLISIIIPIVITLILELILGKDIINNVLLWVRDDIPIYRNTGV